MVAKGTERDYGVVEMTPERCSMCGQMHVPVMVCGIKMIPCPVVREGEFHMLSVKKPRPYTWWTLIGARLAQHATAVACAEWLDS